MYKAKTLKYGAFQAIEYENDQSGNSFTIIPALGANLCKLQLHNGKKSLSVIEGVVEVAPDDNPKYKSAFLLPFPNRVKQGQYVFDGKQYQLQVNETALNNALHGFICDRKFEVTSENLTESSATVVLKNNYPGDNEGYPFPFETVIEITLSDQEGLTIAMEATNAHTEKIPIGMGWHPYFSFGHDADDMLMSIPKCVEIVTDEFCIPTGEKRLFEKFTDLQQMGDSNFDHCFEIDSQSGRVETVIKSLEKDFALHVWQEAGPGKFPYLQIYTPPQRQSIAIEPMTCCIDAFNNHLGLAVLRTRRKVAWGIWDKGKPLTQTRFKTSSTFAIHRAANIFRPCLAKTLLIYIFAPVCIFSFNLEPHEILYA